MNRLAALFLFAIAFGSSAHAADWRTDAERAAYKTTPRYAQTISWLQHLDYACEPLKLVAFGRTPEGREMQVAIAARGGEFTADLARASGKQIVLVQAGIHAGEIEGKDAGLALLRDLCFSKNLSHALDHTILVYIPVFNVDGHERFGPNNRVNQNGPAQMGWRGTGQNINLNRDYIKADAPEMRAWLALFNAWQPDLLVDVHTTDGADYQYDLTWYLEEWDNLDPALRVWQEQSLIERVFPATERRGHLLMPYPELRDSRDLTKGLQNFASGPRYSTGYAALRDRPALLIETHMLKPYGARVRATYDLLVELLKDLDKHPDALRVAVNQAESATLARGAAADARFPLLLAATDKPETFSFKGYAFSNTASEISGESWTRYDPHQKRTFQVPFYRQLEVAQWATLPAAYLIPSAWVARIGERLDAHAIHWYVLKTPRTLDVERYRISAPQWATAPFEGRLMLRSFASTTEKTPLDVPEGWVVVPLDQANANVAVHLLEPEAPDSLLRWGEFNIIFEQREYADARVAEQIARDLLKQRPQLRAEFDQRMQDPSFAGNAAARLAWFFERSKYADPQLGLYPVMRLDAAALAKLRER